MDKWQKIFIVWHTIAITLILIGIFVVICQIKKNQDTLISLYGEEIQIEIEVSD